MPDPEQLGDFESLASLKPTPGPIFAREVGPRSLAWDVASAEAWKKGEPQTGLSIEGRRYYQKTFKYPVHTQDILLENFSRASSDEALLQFLRSTHYLQYLQVAEGDNTT